jgi:hypothetical protein
VRTAQETGFEIELSRHLFATLDGGINFSDLIRQELSGGAVLTDTPGQKLFAYLDWHPLPRLELIPDVDMDSKRWLQNNVDNLVYYRAREFLKESP